MTAQILIDFLFLIILVCHIVKIKHLQEENRIMVAIIDSMQDHLLATDKAVMKNQDHISKLLEWYREILHEKNIRPDED